MKKLILALLLAIIAPGVSFATGQAHHATSKKNHTHKTNNKTVQHKPMVKAKVKAKAKSHSKAVTTKAVDSANQNNVQLTTTSKGLKTKATHVTRKKPLSKKHSSVTHSKKHRHQLAETDRDTINQDNKKPFVANTKSDENNDEAVIAKTTNQKAPLNQSQTSAEPSANSNSENDITENNIPKSNSKVHDLLNYAQSLIGVRYHFGGTNPRSGFDCSGYVSYVFKQVAGVQLPHNAAAISQVGTKISQRDLRPGDLVLFSTFKRGLNHVGIYLGDDRFVHASSSRTGFVEVSDIHDRYWSSRFREVRRLNLFNKSDIN